MKFLTYEEWRALSPKKAADYISEVIFMPENTKKQLEKKLRESKKLEKLLKGDQNDVRKVP